MRLDTSQQLRMSQEMRLSPRIIQAMEILQLPMLSLQERIDTEMESNPVLELSEVRDENLPDTPEEVDDTADRGEVDMVVHDDDSNTEDFQRLDRMTSEFGPDYANSDAPMTRKASNTGEPDRKMEAMANPPASPESLSDYLRDQWRFVEVPNAIKTAGLLIIDSLDPDGYLRTSIEDLAEKINQYLQNYGTAVMTPKETDSSLKVLNEALKYVQTLEPVGVGARDLKECLLIQLHVKSDIGEDVGLPRVLVTNFLREIEMTRLPHIAKRLDRNVDDIKNAITQISKLSPRPGLLIGQKSAPVINPDVIVTIDENDQVVVSMADQNSPRLGINDYYSDTVRDRKTDKKAKQFLRKNIRSAQWLISAIAQRRHTIFRVTQEIFKVQRDFLDHGKEALKPLPMADIADKVGIHIATVSRAVSGKYAQTPQGIFPLRMFFSGGTKTADGQDMSWDAIKEKMREIVDKEDKSAPLNDDKLSEELSKHGIDIARRTVAKYRGVLDILPARKRREY